MMNKMQKTIKILYSIKYSYCMSNTYNNNMNIINLSHGRNLFIKNNLCKYNFCTTSSQHYSEQALSPTDITQQLLQNLTLSTNKQQILHMLQLFYSHLLPFNYDYFKQSLKHIIPYQASLKLNDILMIYSLKIEYQIQSPFFQQHLENQMFCRVYNVYRHQISDYDNQLETIINSTYLKLQQNSQDHFKLIHQQYKDIFEVVDTQDKTHNQEQQQQQQQQNTLLTQNKQNQNNNTPTIIPLYSYKLNRQVPIQNNDQRKKHKKQIKLKQLSLITKMLLDSSSKNVEFHKLLLEIFTCKIDQNQQSLTNNTIKIKEKLKINSQFIMLYTRLTISLLQLLMSQVTSSLDQSLIKQKLTPLTKRSIKSIYKLQSFYYYEIVKILQQNDLILDSQEQVYEFIGLISSFPIKRRSFKKSMTIKMLQMIRKSKNISKNQELKELLNKMFKLSNYDNKLLELYQKQIDLMFDCQLNTQQDNKQLLNSGNGSNSNSFKIPLEYYKKVTKKKNKIKMPKLTEQIDCIQTSTAIKQTQEQIKQFPLTQEK